MKTNSLSSQELYEKDKETIWHAMQRHSPENIPFIVAEADGAWITDIEGKKYLDGMAGLWSVTVGYGRTELAEVVHDQLVRMPYYPMTASHIPAIKLGDKLNEWLDDDYVIFYSNSGSEANETAFKIARQYHWQKGDPERTKFISRYRAYHGSTLSTVAAGGHTEKKIRYGPLPDGFIHVSPPDTYHSPYEGNEEEVGRAYAEEINRVLTFEGETVAGVIMEPMITGGGIIIPPDNYVSEVKKICEKHGVLLIIDEVITGFGRTGEKFGHNHYGIKPDIITMAKGLTSSYQPLSATAVKKDIFETFDDDEKYSFLRHVNTFGGHPAACAVALKNIEIIEEENLVERSRELGKRLAEEMVELYDHPNVGNIRSKGLIMGVEVVEDKETKSPASPDKLDKVVNTCKENGLIIKKNGMSVKGFNNILTICPPLSLTDEDFDFLVNTFKNAVKQL